MVEMPKLILVGSTRYTVERFTPTAGDTGGMLGYQSHLEAKIGVQTGLDPSVEQQTLMHELIHAMWDELGWKKSKRPKQEKVCDMLPRQLLPLLWQNPELVAYFMRGTSGRTLADD